MKFKVNLYIVINIILLLPSHPIFSQTSQQLVKTADSLYKAGNKTGAKEMYIKATSMGNADAHYDLAYYYVVTAAESLYHNTEAAKQGQEKALAEVLDEFGVRACNF